MGIFWYIPITNNVKSCKQINEKAQMANFSIFARSSLLKTWCTEETKTHVSEIVWIVLPIHLSRMEPCRKACPGHLKMYNIWVWSWIDQDTKTHENMDLRGKNCTQNILLFYDASDFYYALRKLFYMIRDCVLKHSKKTPSSNCVFNRT